LKAEGLTWWPAAGGNSDWTHVEESVVIAELDPERACEIGREFGQDAIFVWTPTDWQIRSCSDGGVARRGWVVLPTPPELAAIDAGAEDVERDGSLVTVYTAPNRFEAVRKALEALKLRISDAELSMRPSNTVRLEGEQAKKVLGLVEALEDLDDVQKVHANFDVPEEVLETA